ncbi:hypothetical protein JOH51_005714 [Rhizobium leguminosarum]|nr:hypothetical protein [Rhizobium leguminosarum]
MQPGRTGLAVCMMVAAAFLNSLDAVIVRLLAGDVHPSMIGFSVRFSDFLSSRRGSCPGLV